MMDPNFRSPFEKDVLEEKKKDENSYRKPLAEKDFIQSPTGPAPYTLWVWIVSLTAVAAIIWSIVGSLQQIAVTEKKHDPFLEVTNRELSLFLWQFSSFMRPNVKMKTGYLPGYTIDSTSMYPEKEDAFVSAPPELIFLFHTWNRLLSKDQFSRPIPHDQFLEFLSQVPEWTPKQWKEAPVPYVKLLAGEEFKEIKNLNLLDENQLPSVVRKAFLGWKNYYKEGEQINALSPTFAEVVTFLQEYPDYGRSYWRNISTVVDQKVAGKDYLKALLKDVTKPDEKFPTEQLSPFLKYAMYNSMKAQKGE